MQIRIISALLLASAVALMPNTTFAQERRPSDVPAGELAKVTQVVDGRTLVVDVAGTTQTITLAGLDVPTGSACQATAATASLRSLLTGRLVQLQRDAADAHSGPAGQSVSQTL